MPELPDIASYIVAIEQGFVGQRLQKVVVKSPFVLRTFDPEISCLERQKLSAVTRLGKQLVFHFEAGQCVVLHLMIAGRLQLKPIDRKPTARNDLATFHFDEATLLLTEASKKKRAAIHVVDGPTELARFMRPGINVQEVSCEEFRSALSVRNHTLKRALTDPNLVDGIGNAYSDEILHEARLSPLKWTSRLDDDEWKRLFAACRYVLGRWIEKLSNEARKKWPSKVTAFRPEMAVHGKFGEPCPACDTLVQRIRYADNETNYCPRCQTDGKLLADRSLSRLLKEEWPKTIEDWEAGIFPGQSDRDQD